MNFSRQREALIMTNKPARRHLGSPGNSIPQAAQKIPCSEWVLRHAIELGQVRYIDWAGRKRITDAEIENIRELFGIELSAATTTAEPGAARPVERTVSGAKESADAGGAQGKPGNVSLLDIAARVAALEAGGGEQAPQGVGRQGRRGRKASPARRATKGDYHGRQLTPAE
jgi:hypothetical protein